MQRYDNYQLQAQVTNEGFIEDSPIVGRTGILIYQNPDGSMRREYRPPEEAFNEQSLLSLKGKPITVGHHGVVTNRNIDIIHPVGTVLSSGRQDENNIIADVIIYNLPTPDRELSCGYSLDLEETSGVTADGEHYDAIQRNIRYNHLAIVHRGRAGVSRLNMDGDQIFDEEDEMEELKKEDLKKELKEELKKELAQDSTEKEKVMEKLRIDNGLEYDAAPEVKVYAEKLAKELADLKDAMAENQKQSDADISALKDEIEKLKVQNAEAVGQTKKAEGDCDTVKNELELAKKDNEEITQEKEALQAKADSLEASVKQLKEDAETKENEFKAKFDEAVKARIAMLDVAHSHKIDNADSMSDREIKIAVIKSVRGDSMNLDDKSDVYVDAAFDFCKNEETHSDGVEKQRAELENREPVKKVETKSDSLDDMSIEEMERRLREEESQLYLKGVK
jgi:uncharacterized protein